MSGEQERSNGEKLAQKWSGSVLEINDVISQHIMKMDAFSQIMKAALEKSKKPTVKKIFSKAPAEIPEKDLKFFYDKLKEMRQAANDFLNDFNTFVNEGNNDSFKKRGEALMFSTTGLMQALGPLVICEEYDRQRPEIKRALMSAVGSENLNNVKGFFKDSSFYKENQEAFDSNQGCLHKKSINDLMVSSAQLLMRIPMLLEATKGHAEHMELNNEKESDVKKSEILKNIQSNATQMSKNANDAVFSLNRHLSVNQDYLKSSFSIFSRKQFNKEVAESSIDILRHHMKKAAGDLNQVSISAKCEGGSKEDKDTHSLSSNNRSSVNSNNSSQSSIDSAEITTYTPAATKHNKSSQ